MALVTGTNGKTTTTRMLVAALSDGRGAVVVSNDTGANMPAGHVAALAGAPAGAAAVLEVDEGYLGRLIEETAPKVVLLLNLSRDQMDRISEVRMLVDRWRAALGRLRDGPGAGVEVPATVVVANADDPMVTWAALAAPDVVWVGVGQVWHLDAVGCPACGGRIHFDGAGSWACDRCGFARPPRAAWLERSDLVLPGGERFEMALGLPGQFNRANAAMAAVAAELMGAGSGRPGTSVPAEDLPAVLARLASVDQVAGRFSSILRRGRSVRLLLAKNPAGWTAIFDLLEEEAGSGPPVVLSVNARTADGLDTSWLWDVPFERLAGRSVVATGDRRLDLAVRLRYAGVDAEVVVDPTDAVDRALGTATGIVTPRRRGQLHGLRRPAGPGRTMTAGSARRALTIAVVYPDLLGTYGDGGNALVLTRRATWRGIDAELVQADSGSPLPGADIYCLGGGEDGPQVRAAEALVADGELHRAVDRGAVVLGVCAGFQLLGHSFPDSVDRPHPGLGLLDVTTRKGTGSRAVGELVASPTDEAPRLSGGRSAPLAHRIREPRRRHHRRTRRPAPGPGGPGRGQRGRLWHRGGVAGEGARVLPARAVAGPQRGLGRPAVGLGALPDGRTGRPGPLGDVDEAALRDERLSAAGAPGPGLWQRLRSLVRRPGT